MNLFNILVLLINRAITNSLKLNNEVQLLDIELIEKHRFGRATREWIASNQEYLKYLEEFKKELR